MAERFSAFISYSHSDEAVARWLHRAIEGYRFPPAVVGSETPFGPVPKKLPPVFRDRDELAASGDLGAELREALASSRFQIVICSPKAAGSHWVNEEILIFKRQHGEHRTVALIAGGEPYGSGADECFPEALRFQLDAAGNLSDQPAEPIAADIRPGKDGKRLALLKLLAGISGVRLDALVRRDQARRQRRLAAVATVSSVIALVTVGLAIYAESQRRVAVAQRDLAESSLSFLVGTFEIANPATENPRTITALTVLERASERAAGEFARQPMVAARLLRTTGDIYSNLGLLEEAEHDLKLALRMSQSRGAERALILLKLATVAQMRGDADMMERLTSQAEAAYPENLVNNLELAAFITDQRAKTALLRAQYREAAKLFATARTLYMQAGGDFRQEIGTSYMNEATALATAQDHQQIAQNFQRIDHLYSEAVRVFSQKYGMRDVHTARALSNQAGAALFADMPQTALPRAQQALAIFKHVLDPNHPNIAAAEILIGRIFLAQNQPRAALDNFLNARQIFLKLYGAENPAVGDASFYAAEAQAAAGRSAEALRLTQEVGRIYTAAYGPDDPDQAELLLLRARIMESGGSEERAARECWQAFALQQRLGMERQVLGQTRAYCNELTA